MASLKENLQHNIFGKSRNIDNPYKRITAKLLSCREKKKVYDNMGPEMHIITE
jgi:hypothetical protein